MSTAKAYRHLHFISMLFLTVLLSTFVLAYKMVAIGNFIGSGAVFIFPIVYALADITTEVYGCDQMKKLIQQAFCCCLVFSLFIPIITFLPSPENWVHQPSYNYVLGNLFRLFIASTVGLMVGLTVNSYLIYRWQTLLRGQSFWLRSIGATAIGQLTTSLIADSIAFAGMMEFAPMVKFIVALYFSKVLLTVLLAWPSTLLVTYLRMREGVDFFSSSPPSNWFKNYHPLS